MATQPVADNPLSAFFRGFTTARQRVKDEEQQAVQNELARQLREIQSISAMKQLQEINKTPQERIIEALNEGLAKQAATPESGISLRPALQQQTPVDTEGIALPPALKEGESPVSDLFTFNPKVPEAVEQRKLAGQKELSDIRAPAVKKVPLGMSADGKNVVVFNPETSSVELSPIPGSEGGMVALPGKGGAGERGRSVLAKNKETNQLTNFVLKSGESLPEGYEERASSTGKSADSSALRKEFNALPEVKNYKELSRQMGLMRAAYERIGDAKGKGFIDQTLITTFNKILDPTSVVRESEYARTPEGVALLNRIEGKIKQFSEGGVGLTDRDRAELMQTAEALYARGEEPYRNVKNYYTFVAKEGGHDPRTVVEDIYNQSQKEGSSSSAPIKIKSIRLKK